MEIALRQVGTMADASFRADRLNQLMQQRDFTDGKLAYASGVSRSMIFYMRKGERSKVSAGIVAAIAGTLGTSQQYLMGQTDDPSPTQKTMSAVAANIVDIVNKLPPSKRREYQELGKALLAADEASDVETIYEELMERITRLAEIEGGEAALARLLNHLSAASGRVSDSGEPTETGKSLLRRLRRSRRDSDPADKPA